jgi:hypothetical protein
VPNWGEGKKTNDNFSIYGVGSFVWKCIVLFAFSCMVYCLRNGLPLDMDVYDLAEWCCMADLTRLSIENGNAPVAVPDFTRGNWNKVDGYHHAFAQ